MLAAMRRASSRVSSLAAVQLAPSVVAMDGDAVGCLTRREEPRLSRARRSLAQHAPKEQRGNLPYDGKQAQFSNRQYQPQIYCGHPLRSCAERDPQWLTNSYLCLILRINA